MMFRKSALLLVSGIFIGTTFAGSPLLQFGSAVQAQPSIQSTENPAEWEEFTSIEQGFTVRMPGTPSTQENALEPGIQANQALFILELDNNQGAYGVNVLESPFGANQLPPEQLEAAFDLLQQGLTEGGQLLSQENITLGAVPGREIRFQNQDGYFLAARIFWVGQRWYKVMAIAPSETGLDEIAPPFFDSFEFLPETLEAAAQLPQLAQRPTPDPARAAEVTRLTAEGFQHLQQGQIEEALTVFEQALTFYQETQDRAGEGLILGALGTAYEESGQYDQALTRYQAALAIAQQRNDDLSQLILLMGLGRTYTQLNQYDSALAHYEQARAIAIANEDRATESLILNGMGSAHIRQSNYPEANRLYQEGLVLAQEIGDRATEATVLGNLGYIAENLAQYPQALDYHQRALAINQQLGRRWNEALTLNNIGAVYLQQSQYDQASDYFERAIALGEALEDRTIIGSALSNLGLIYDNLAQYPQALDYYQQALELRRQTQDRQGEGVTLGNIGSIRISLSQYEQAATVFEQALGIFREIGDRNGEATMLNNIGGLYNRQSRFAAAIDAYQQALAIQKTIGDRAGQSTTLSNLGNTYSNLGQYAEALEHYQQSQSIAQDMGDRPREASTLNNLGNLYDQLGRYTEALALYQEALEVHRQVGNRAETATALNNIGRTHERLEQFAEAATAIEAALEISQDIGDRASQGITLNNLGAVYEYLGRYDEALAFYQQALTIEAEIGNRAQEATILNNLGLAHTKQGQYDRALEYLEQALAIQTEIGDRPGSSITLTNLGRTLYETGQFAQATTQLLAAVEIWESLRPGLSDPDKVSLFDTQTITYRLLQRSLIAEGKVGEAMEAAERSRARTFAELLARRLDTEPDFSSDEPEASFPTVEAIQDIARSQQATLVEYSLIPEGETPQLYIWVVQPNGDIAFRSVDLPDPATLNLNDSPNQPLTTQIAAARSALGAGDRSITVQPDDAIGTTAETSRLQTLHHLLIDPIADLLPTQAGDRVIFIPQGDLFLVPFPALQADDGRYLIEQHTVLTAPSIQVLGLAQQQRMALGNRRGTTRGFGNPPQPNHTADDILIVGNPTMPTLPSLPPNPPQVLPSLPGAEREAQAIANFLGTEPILGDQATEAVVRQRMTQARLIHLATHGLLEYGIPGESLVQDVPGAVALAPTADSDGLLTARDILDLDLKAELVVLSACDTGRGIISGDGVLGLSRSLMSAGVPSVIVSLWAVPDAPTADLMTEFYRQLQQNPDKAQALRQAMLKTMQDHPHPRDWAAFTLIGEAQ